MRENFDESPMLVYKDVLNRIKDNLNFCDSVIYALNERVGVIDEETPLINEVSRAAEMRVPQFFAE